MKTRVSIPLVLAIAFVARYIANSYAVDAQPHGPIHVQTDEPGKDALFIHTVECYPTEIYFGDTVYIVATDENISGRDIKGAPGIGAYPLFYYGKGAVVTANGIQGEYHWRPETPNGMLGTMSPMYASFAPGWKNPGNKIYLEFPPLESWNEPFWKEIREKLTPEGVVCQLQFVDDLFLEGQGAECQGSDLRTCKRTLTQEILIKPRPENEMAILDKWYKNTPENYWPENYYERKESESYIKIKGTDYHPNDFIRIGNRKPGEPNNPATLEEWRDLENQFIPSTMRDEIRFVRMQLEIFEAEDGKKTDEAIREFVDWLGSTPAPQASIMTTFLVSKLHHFHNTPLEAKNRQLMRTAYELLDVPNRKVICNNESERYDDLTLTPPPLSYVIPSFRRQIRPTEEEMASGSKDLPDGYRIWHKIMPDGKEEYFVAKFDEYDENSDLLWFVARDGFGRKFGVLSSRISAEDRRYIEENPKPAKESDEDAESADCDSETYDSDEYEPDEE